MGKQGAYIQDLYERSGSSDLLVLIVTLNVEKIIFISQWVNNICISMLKWCHFFFHKLISILFAVLMDMLGGTM